MSQRKEPRRTKIQEKNSREMKQEQIEEMKQELQKSSRIREENSNKDPKCKLPKLVISQSNSAHFNYFRF